MLVLSQPWARQPQGRRPARNGLILINAADRVCANNGRAFSGLGVRAAPDGEALYAASASLYGSVPVPGVAIGTGDFTAALYWRQAAQTGLYCYALGANASFAFAARHQNSANNAGMYLSGSLVSSGQMASDAGAYRAVVRRSSGTLYVNINGSETTAASAHNIAAINTLVLNSYQTMGAYGLAGGAHYYLAGLEPRAWSDVEVAAFLGNPWGLYEDEEILVFPTAASGTDLAGDAAAQASVSGDLATGIPILGAALAVSAGSAALTTGMPLAGAAASTTVASGQLVTSITLSGAALAQAVAGAALSSGIILTADSVAQAAAQGQLDSLIALLGAAVASSTATGSLDGAGASLAGAASAQAAASAAITVQIRLDVAALAAAAAAAGLDTGVLLAGSGAGNAAAGGALTTGIPLDAAALAAAIAAGSLTAVIRLGVQAAAAAAGAAGLDTQIIVAGQAVAQATASAALTTTPSSVADGPVWLIAGVAPLADYAAAVLPASTWSAAAALAASYLAGVARVQ